MAVMVDHSPLHVDELGFQTVGQVLSHLQRENRLVVHVLIDGQTPNLSQMGAVRKSPLLGHTVFIETADPREIALNVLDGVAAQLSQADRAKSEAADLLQKGETAPAMSKLSSCFSTWQNAQQSITQTAQLLKIDLTTFIVDGRAMTDLNAEFAEQLKQIKSALENRDFVTLADILTYETTETTARWSAAVREMRKAVK
jgi:hypothetical protein